MTVQRKLFVYAVRWSATFCWFYVLCSCTTPVSSNERVRHPYAKLEDDLYVSQLERTSSEESPRLESCPNCAYEAEEKAEGDTDGLRLEAIKRQILTKLGLRQKPNVTRVLPREVVMETLFRAEDSSEFFRNFDEEEHTTSDRTYAEEAMEYDDFYGRTSEIISFAEQGSVVNNNRLLEFRVSPESGSAGQGFRVRSATLWLKADIRRHIPQTCRSIIYIFKIISRLPETVTFSEQELYRATTDPIPVPLNYTTGWQKIDLTETVTLWLTNGSEDRLRLFVDCSCCSHWHVHLLNRRPGIDHQNRRPFLVIRTDPTTSKRVRRRALDCSPGLGSLCCKQRFYVSFKELGWDDWVIAPQGYYANYCRGDCGGHRTPDTYLTYHTQVIEQVRKNTRHLSGTQPCCAPLKFSSMDMLYYAGPELNIIKRTMPKMVIDECGCP